MAFGVFSPAQSRAESERRSSVDAARAHVIAETTQELLKTRKEVEDEFAATMKEKERIAREFHEEQVAKKKELEKEVERLEQRRKEALSPLLIKEEDIHSVQEALKARELELDEREEQNEETQRILMRRLDECSGREQDLDSREKRVRQMEQGAEFQRSQVANDARRLSLATTEFQKRVEDKETEMAFRQSELDAQKKLYDDNDRKLVEREKEIEAGKRLIADQRLLLEKGFKELRLKQYDK